ncbi:Uncharacterised protein r2_g311 [Pycnogonum litorale]
MPDTEEAVKTVNVTPASSDGVDVGAVALNLPPFWSADPVLWFRQVEVQFVLQNIVHKHTKFSHLIATLNPRSPWKYATSFWPRQVRILMIS